MTYDTIPAVRASGIVKYAECPAAYRHYIDAPHESTPTLRRGQRVHCALFEPDQYPQRYTVLPEGGRRPRGEDPQRFVTAAEEAETQAIVSALRRFANPDWQAALAYGLREHTILWTDEVTDVPCKSRLDLFHDGTIWDVKTTRSVSPHAFAGQAAALHYHAKAAFYWRGCAALGMNPRRWVWIAVAVDEPHFVRAYELTPADLERGNEAISTWLAMHAECVRNNHWPDYGTEITPLELPAYAAGSEMEITDGENTIGV